MDESKLKHQRKIMKIHTKLLFLVEYVAGKVFNQLKLARNLLYLLVRLILDVTFLELLLLTSAGIV